MDKKTCINFKFAESSSRLTIIFLKIKELFKKSLNYILRRNFLNNSVLGYLMILS